MAEPWLLVLDRPAGDPQKKVGGLALALRLALDAQWAGASAIAVTPEARAARVPLADPRLRIPLLDTIAENSRVVRVSASTLVHRQLFKAALAEPWPARERDLRHERIAFSAPFAFDPIDVIDRRSQRLAERLLFRSLRKPEDGWTSRWLNRYISLALSRRLVNTPLLPNQVSIMILAVGLLGAWLATRGTHWSMVAGAFLFQAQSVLDGCDGEMSRVTYRGSLLGEWLDTVGDDLTNYGFFTGAGVGMYRMTDQALYLVAAAVTVSAGAIASIIEYRYLLRIGSGDLLRYPLSAAREASEPTGAFEAIRPLFKRDTFVFLTLLAAIIGLLGPMLVVFAAAAVGILVSVILAEQRMARERRAAGLQGTK